MSNDFKKIYTDFDRLYNSKIRKFPLEYFSKEKHVDHFIILSFIKKTISKDGIFKRRSDSSSSEIEDEEEKKNLLIDVKKNIDNLKNKFNLKSEKKFIFYFLEKKFKNFFEFISKDFKNAENE